MTIEVHFKSKNKENLLEECSYIKIENGFLEIHDVFKAEVHFYNIDTIEHFHLS